jgi:hypothetical protein
VKPGVWAASLERDPVKINEPGAIVTPTALASDAQAIARKHKGTVNVTVLNAKKCQERLDHLQTEPFPFWKQLPLGLTPGSEDVLQVLGERGDLDPNNAASARWVSHAVSSRNSTPTFTAPSGAL